MSHPIRLLYAEDNALDADLTRAHFEQVASDFELSIVDTGVACLAQLSQHSFDVLMLDNHLPDMDGMDVLIELRTKGLRLPVVMVTGVGDDETVASALRAGASDYVPKSGDYLLDLPPLLRVLLARQQVQHQFEGEDAWREQNILYIEPNAMDAELALHHFSTHAPRLRLHLHSSCVDSLVLLSKPHGFDLVLTDLRVPGMDALEFLHEVRRRQLDVPVVIITGKGDEATAVALLRLGASDYLVKRDNYLMQLPHAIENALHRFRLDQTTHRLHGELQALNAALEAKVLERTAELQHLQASLRATFDTIPDLIWQKDADGHFLACNPALAGLLGLPPAAVLGRTDADLFDVETAKRLSERHQRVVDSAKPMVWEQRLRHVGRDGDVLFEQVSTPMLGPGGCVHGVLSVARDITERKQTELALQVSLKDKEALLKEVHHRVNNNLQVIISLLRLEGRRSTQADAKQVLAEMQGRIRSMALLHQSLYRAGTFASVDLGSYLKQIATQAFGAQSLHADRVQLKLNTGSLQVGMDQALCAGLLVNELISNCLKHGFPDGRCGEVCIELQPAGNDCLWRLSVLDSGVGLAPDFEQKREAALGLQLVGDLSQQIGGTLTIDSPAGQGVRFTIVFTAHAPTALVMPE